VGHVFETALCNGSARVLHELTSSSFGTGFRTRGELVSTDGDRVIVALGPKRAHVFDATTGKQMAELVASDVRADIHPRSVAISGDKVVLGVWAHAPGAGSNRGAAYLFDLSQGQ